MPPAIVKTIKDLIFWQYTKLISTSAGFGPKNYGFRMERFKKLRDGEIHWSSTVREYIKEHEKSDECIYCGSHRKLEREHILPRSRGGPDTVENSIWVCKQCNLNKSDKRLYEWKGLEHKDEIPRIAEGKYLKLLYELHEELGTLAVRKKELPSEICPKCDMGARCEIEKHQGKLTVYCLEGMFDKE
ncbi:MAG: HNH endonuclease [Candidatus Helarchaeota archaeon]|nr:HNH endonuclease [Candidatus Helarchaeota archaeon]